MVPMRVLIADDEIKVINLISHLIDWEGLGLELAGTVHDGSSALEFIEANKPDIVITDIRMPGLNGIELIRRIRENGRDTRVIIISGYRQFEDANQAIKYGVEDYLLKPLKQKELERVLRKIIQRHNQEWESTEERDLMRRQVNQSIMQVKAQWFYLLLSGAAPQGDKGAVPAFAGPLFQIIQFRAVPLMGGADIQGVLNRKVYEILEGELTGSFREVVPIMQEDGVDCLMCGDRAAFDSLRKFIKRTVGRIHALSDIFERTDVMVALSTVTDRVEALPECAHQVELAAAQRLFASPDEVIEYDPSCEPTVDLQDLIDARLRADFRKQLEMLSADGVREWVRSVASRVQAFGVRSGWTVRQVFVQALALLEADAPELGFSLDAAFRPGLIRRLKGARRVDEAFALLEEGIGECVAAWRSAKDVEGLRPILLAKRYIHEHYHEPLTLHSVSTVIGFNPSYFSSVFKRETGENFLDYLTNERIVGAKELLVSTSLSVGEIAEKVGYQDLKYFYKRFKQSTGLGPKEYRKLYG